MYLYAIYGLTLSSDLSLPGLKAGCGKPDVIIQVKQAGTVRDRQRTLIECKAATRSAAHLVWGGVGELRIENGASITVTTGEDAEEDALRLFILGAGIGVLLHQRGLLVLHGSGVSINGCGVGFIGAKGWGKSTTAAAFDQAGDPLVSDELLAITFDDTGHPLLIPGSADIRLWDDALACSAYNANDAVRVRSGVDKFCVSASAVAEGLVVFSHLYLLDMGDTLGIEELELTSALLQTVPHLYVARFGNAFTRVASPKHALAQLALLTRRVQVKRLRRRESLADLAEIVHRIRADVREFPGACALA